MGHRQQDDLGRRAMIPSRAPYPLNCTPAIITAIMKITAIMNATKVWCVTGASRGLAAKEWYKNDAPPATHPDK